MITRFEEELLISHALGLSRSQLLARKREELDPNLYQPLLDRRAQHEPTAYIIGSQPFFGLDILVNPSVLIPRPETELLVETVISHLSSVIDQRKKTGDRKLLTIADLGTGSGCIAIALAKNLPGIKVLATDASPEALQLARQNAKKHEVENRIEFFLRQEFSLPTPVEFIVSNPPYIPTKVIETLEPEVKDREPRLALDGGPDGLNFIRKLIKLEYNLLIMEFGFGQGEAIRSLAKEQGKRTKIMKDYAGIERIAIVN